MGINEECLRLWLDNIVDTLPGLTGDLQARKLDLADTEAICFFGYGSLIDSPVRNPTRTVEALLHGWRRDFCCACLRTGTPDRPGLTLGLSKHDNVATPGAAILYEDLPLEQRIVLIDEFTRREAPPNNPTYTFRLLDVETVDGEHLPAIVCVSDHTTERYFGDGLSEEERATLSPEEREELSIMRKAAVIASSYNNQRGDDHRTSKSYFDRFVRNPAVEKLAEFDRRRDLTPFEQAMQVEIRYIARLGEAVDEHRARLPGDLRKIIEQIEDMQMARYLEAQERRAGK